MAFKMTGPSLYKKSVYKHAVTAGGHKHIDAPKPQKGPAPAGKVDRSKLELL
mgnify:CR=1 FL=1